MTSLVLQLVALICCLTLWYWAGRYGCMAVVFGIILMSSIYVAMGGQ